MRPPPAAPASSVCHSTFPFSASKAKAWLPRSPAKTRPPLVGVTPASAGAVVRKRHLTCPVSASVAITKPPQLGSFLPKRLPSPLPVHCCPSETLAGFVGSTTTTVVHQSSEPS